jgi:hypothetical protein
VKRIRERVAGLDVHRDTVVACCEVKQPDRSIEVTKQSFSTTAKGLGELAAWLSDAGVETVAMEATGVYWKPVVRHEALFDREGMKGPLLLDRHRVDVVRGHPRPGGRRYQSRPADRPLPGRLTY